MLALETPCIPFNGRIDPKGYCRLGKYLAHRLAYETFVGPIPAGLVIDHLCRVRNCVNAEHLEVVTNRENIMRGVGHTAVNAQKTHCHKGHPFTPDNMYPSPYGWRKCRTCIREYQNTTRRGKKR